MKVVLNRTYIYPRFGRLFYFTQTFVVLSADILESVLSDVWMFVCHEYIEHVDSRIEVYRLSQKKSRRRWSDMRFLIDC